MLKLIDVPGHIFLVCALNLKNKLESQGDKVYLVARSISKPGYDWFSGIENKEQYNLLSYKDVASKVIECVGETEYVVMHHNASYNGGLQNIFRSLTRTGKSLVVSLYPDGIANYAVPKPFNHDYFLSINPEIIFRHFYFFGKKHTAMPTGFSEYNITPVYVPVNNVYDVVNPLVKNYTSKIQKYWEDITSSCNELSYKRICFVVLRCWCAGEGYGGRYNFGNGTETLSDIYIDIINRTYPNLSDTLFIVRDDSRVKKSHPELASLIKQKSENINLSILPSDYLPAHFNFEFILSTMPQVMREKLHLDMVTLDSLSGFYAPFLFNKGTIIMGASSDFLAKCGASEEQVTKISENVNARVKNISSVWSNAQDTKGGATYDHEDMGTGIVALTYNGFS